MAKIAFCILATDTTDRRTDEQTNRWTDALHEAALAIASGGLIIRFMHFLLILRWRDSQSSVHVGLHICWNCRSLLYSLVGTKVPGSKLPGSESSKERKFQVWRRTSPRLVRYIHTNTHTTRSIRDYIDRLRPIISALNQRRWGRMNQHSLALHPNRAKNAGNNL